MVSTEKVIIIRPKQKWSLNELTELWSFRELLMTLVERDIKVRYRQTVIGGLWALIQPLLTAVIFTAIFSRITTGVVGVPYTVFSFSGLILWVYFTNSVSTASNSLVGSSNLITKVYFPRLIIPISSTIVGLIDYVVSLIFLFGLVIWFHIPLHLNLLLLPIILGLVWLLATGFGAWLAAINVKYRDVKYVVPFFLQLGMFVTPIIYPLSDTPRLKNLLMLNPMAGYVEAHRAIFTNQLLDPWSLLLAIFITFVITILGIRYFRSVEKFFADII